MAAQLDRSIVITGSGSGIGAATARRLAAPGTGILVHAKDNETGVATVARELEAKGAVTTGFCADLAEEHAADRVIDRAIGSFGRIDALLHVAGYPVGGGFGADQASAEEGFMPSPSPSTAWSRARCPI